MAYSMIANCTLFIALFTDFYIKAYKKPKNKSQRAGENSKFSNGLENSKIVNGGKENGKTVNSSLNSNTVNGVDEMSTGVLNNKIEKFMKLRTA